MGLGLVIVGAILVLLAFTALDWYSGAGGPDSVGSSGFSDLHHNAGQLGANGITSAYFSWISWVLLILVIVVGTLASAMPRLGEAARTGGLLIGLIGVALTYYALHSISFSGHVFDHAASGVWLALVGYLLAGVGAAVGTWPAGRRLATAGPAPGRPAEPPPASSSSSRPSTPAPAPAPAPLPEREPEPEPATAAAEPSRPRPSPHKRPSPS